jgi:poly-gamma-glutamate synthesis protein (capsule biosynthesis protein)
MSIIEAFTDGKATKLHIILSLLQMKASIYKALLKNVLLSGCFILLGLRIHGQSAENFSRRISMLFIGDIMGHDTQIWSAEDRKTRSYNYDDVFEHIKPVISGADIAVANLEVTLAGPPYKGYPQFSSPAALAAACRDAGIDCLLTANNHCADRGGKGIRATIFRLDSLGILHTGTFTDAVSRDKQQPLMIERNGISVAFLNYTYGTNGLPVPSPLVVNILDRERVTEDISRAQELNPDIIVLCLHWGTEYDTIPSPQQHEMAEYFLSKGAGLVIGSHPHVIQKMVWYDDGSNYPGKAVVYSLGNFVSNQRKPLTDGGAIARIVLEKKNGTVKVADAGYILTWVYTPVIEYRLKFYTLPCSEFTQKPDFFRKKEDYIQMMRFITSSRRLLNRENSGFREIITY